MKTNICIGLLLLLTACGDDVTASSDGSTSDPSPTSGPATSSPTFPDTTGGTVAPDTTTETTGGEPGTSTSEGDTEEPSDWPDPKPPLPCPDESNCAADRDGDDFPYQCDNAPEHANPDQGDMDFDSIGDIVDLCPTVQSLHNSFDSDRDGIGTECDRCPRPASNYLAAGGGNLDPAFTFRAMPDQGDADGDGIGDACDNCVQTPNCLGYGEGLVHELGIQLDIEDPDCQADIDGDYIGNACEGTMGPGAAGPVGFGPDDDFDQDGLANSVDGCVRLPVSSGRTQHLDSDADGLGDRCDNCPFTANPDQADDDSDAVGDACEAPGCLTRANPRRMGFFDESAGGMCCTTVHDGSPMFDPDGNPLAVTDLPAQPTGVLTLPPGCSGEANPVTLDDVANDDDLWDYLCLMPQWDQDYDGIPDACDLCPFAFDPTNAPFVDSNGMTWPNDGAYCNGDYHCSAD